MHVLLFCQSDSLKLLLTNPLMNWHSLDESISIKLPNWSEKHKVQASCDPSLHSFNISIPSLPHSITPSSCFFNICLPLLITPSLFLLTLFFHLLYDISFPHHLFFPDPSSRIHYSLLPLGLFIQFFFLIPLPLVSFWVSPLVACFPHSHNRMLSFTLNLCLLSWIHQFYLDSPFPCHLILPFLLSSLSSIECPFTYYFIDYHSLITSFTFSPPPPPFTSFHSFLYLPFQTDFLFLPCSLLSFCPTSLFFFF